MGDSCPRTRGSSAGSRGGGGVGGSVRKQRRPTFLKGLVFVGECGPFQDRDKHPGADLVRLQAGFVE